MTSPDNLTHEEIGRLLAEFAEIRDWMTAVESYALNELQNGKAIPGFVLGETRPTRIWSNEEVVYKKLIDGGYSPDVITPRTLLSVAQMEKVLGKAASAALLADSIGYKQGLPKVVPVKS